MFSNPIRASRTFFRRDDGQRHTASSHSALALPGCASTLQPATPLHVVVFESWAISATICPNRVPSWFRFESRKPNLSTCVCVLTFSLSAFAFLIEMDFSFRSLLSSPQRFHYYFYCSIDSWQHQKYWTILILVLCLLCVMPLVCSFYSSFAPPSPFFNSWWQRDWDWFAHTLGLWGSPSTVTSSRQPQTTHVFASW